MANLGLQNNNPGNLRDPATGAFRQFNTPEEGHAALIEDIKAKQTGKSSHIKPGQSIEDFANVWAPAADKNNPHNYAQTLAKFLGVPTAYAFDQVPADKLAGAIKVAEGTTALPDGSSTPKTKLSPDDFAKKIRAKYPGAYDDIDSQTLTSKILTKYPQYHDMVDASQINLPDSSGGQSQDGGSMFGNFAKSIVSPVATMLARPVQAGAELLGASAESVDKFSKDHLGGVVAPVPQNAGDVEKDIGRGIQTVALGAGPESMATAGAGFGLGGSLEQGNDLLSVQTAFETALGAVGGKLIGLVGKPIFNVAGKVVGEVTPAFLKDLAAQGTEAIQKFAADHEILPKGITDAADKVGSKLSNVADVTKQAVKDELPSFGNKSTDEIYATAAKDVGSLSARDQKIWHDNQAKISIDAAKAAGEKSLAESKVKIQEFSSKVAQAGEDKATTLKEPAKQLMKTSSQQYQALAEDSVKNSPNMDKTMAHTDLSEKIDTKFEHDPEIADTLKQDLGLSDDSKKTVTNQEILDKAREIMSGVSKSAKAGNASYSSAEYEAMKKYSFLMDTLNDNGVDMSEANKFWREWKPVQKQIIRDIKPFNNEKGSLPSTLNKSTATANTPAQAVAKQKAAAFIKELETRLKLPEGSIDAETRQAMEGLEKEKLNQANLRKINQQIVKEIRTTTKNTKLDISATEENKKIIRRVILTVLGLGAISQTGMGKAAVHAGMAATGL